MITSPGSHPGGDHDPDEWQLRRGGATRPLTLLIIIDAVAGPTLALSREIDPPRAT